MGGWGGVKDNSGGDECRGVGSWSIGHGLAELSAIDASQDRLGNHALQGAGQAGPSAGAVRAELEAEALCCVAKEAAEHVLAFLVDRTQGLEHHGAELVLSALETEVVLLVLLADGVLLAGLREADTGQGQGARDCDVDGKTFTLGPQRNRHITWAATRGRTKDTLLFHNGSEHAVRGDVVH